MLWIDLNIFYFNRNALDCTEKIFIWLGNFPDNEWWIDETCPRLCPWTGIGIKKFHWSVVQKQSSCIITSEYLRQLECEAVFELCQFIHLFAGLSKILCVMHISKSDTVSYTKWDVSLVITLPFNFLRSVYEYVWIKYPHYPPAWIH